MPVNFDITPEKEASFSQFLYRQLFVRPKAITKKDADLSGQVAIVTGSSGGIGLECACQLLDIGVSKLILGVRDEAKAGALVDKISAGHNPKPIIEVWGLNYHSYDSILNFVERAKKLDRLDVVILNAGVYRATMNLIPSTGHEENIQVNYLSTVLLLVKLLPILKAKALGARPGRITMVSSDTAAWYTLKEKDQDPLLPSFDKEQPNFNHHERYAISKLLGQLFIVELVKRVPSSVAIINCVNPGFCHSSGLSRDADGTTLGLFVGIMGRLLGRSPSMGARCVVDAAVNHGAEVHGQYVEDCKLTPMSPFVYSADAKQVIPRLWKETMNELSSTGVERVIEGLGSG
ncbi:NAD(P)-binding protein [Xylaria cf. heliscus]|nr:NAD(P)-binding protein [Xylaria cf. heliscus]